MLSNKSLCAVLLLLASSVVAEHGASNRRQNQHARLARSAAGGNNDRMRMVRRGADAKKCRVRSSTNSSSSAVPPASAVVTSAGAAVALASTASAATASETQSSAAASAAASAVSSAASPGTTSASGLTPNNNKAGIAGGDALPWIGSKLGWWYDWSPAPSNSDSGSAISVPMIWGGGSVDGTDSSRLAAFKALTPSSSTPYIIGFEEPDCTSGSGSADMDYTTAANLWNELVVPHGEAGSLLLSPSMCHQAAETGWLQPFQGLISRDWDITNIHINKNNMDGVRADIDHYYTTYGKPIWVTEFACVDDSSSFIPCTDQSEIDSYISEIVDLFESDSRVYAYGYSDGEGLGDVWPSVKNGALSGSGQAYLNAISKYH